MRSKPIGTILIARRCGICSSGAAPSAGSPRWPRSELSASIRRIVLRDEAHCRFEHLLARRGARQPVILLAKGDELVGLARVLQGIGHCRALLERHHGVVLAMD